MKQVKLRLMGGVALFMVCGGSAIAQTERPGSGNSPADDVEASSDIIVTATRREQRLIDVSQSLSVVSAQDLERRGDRDMADYLRSVPGVAFTGTGTADNAIVIRGLTAATSNQGLGSGGTVSIYFGETSTTGSGGPFGGSSIDPKPVDLARVEVLRGPQGTSFGDAAIGGVVRLVPQEPILGKTEARVTADLSRTGRYGGGNSRLEGVINLPVADTLAVRGVLYRFNDSGYYKNIVGIDPVSLTRANSLNIGDVVRGLVDGDSGRLRTTGGRVSVLWQPSDSFDVTLSVLRQRQEQDGIAWAGAAGSYLVAGNSGGFPISPRARIRSQVFASHTNELTIVNGVANYKLDWGTWTTSLSYLKGDYDLGSDFTYIFNVPLGALINNNAKHRIAESRFVSSFSNFVDFIVGGYYQRTTSSALATNYAWGAPAVNPYATDPAYYIDRQNYITQKAIYGELTLRPLKNVEATFGGRYFGYDVRNYDGRAGAGLNGRPLDNPIIIDNRASSSRAVYKAGLSFKPGDDLNIYAQWSQGYRLGRTSGGLVSFGSTCDVNGDGVVDGTNVTIADTTQIDPDSVNSYEIGIKARVANRINVSAAAFWVDWKDVPSNVGAICSGVSRLYTDNIGDAVSKGFELSVQGEVTRGLNANFNLSYVDAKITKGSTFGAEGARLPGAPTWSGNFGLEYNFEIGSREAFIRTDLLYTGKQDFAIGFVSAEAKAGGYVQADARAGVKIGNADLSLYVQNVTNNDARVSGYFSTNSALQLRPRTVGVTVGYGF